MQIMPKTVTPREIQRSYRKIFDEVKETQEPVVVMKNNKPEVAIVSIKKLYELDKKKPAQTKSPGQAIKPLYGMWKNRKEWKDKKGYEIVRELRSKRLKRIYGKRRFPN